MHQDNCRDTVAYHSGSALNIFQILDRHAISGTSRSAEMVSHQLWDSINQKMFWGCSGFKVGILLACLPLWMYRKDMTHVSASTFIAMMMYQSLNWSKCYVQHPDIRFHQQGPAPCTFDMGLRCYLFQCPIHREILTGCSLYGLIKCHAFVTFLYSHT